MADQCTGSGDDPLLAGLIDSGPRMAAALAARLLVGSVAVVLGAALAAFYLFPAVYEQKWVNIAQAVSAGSRPLDNFLFVHTADADHDAFNRVISWIAVAEIALTMVAAWVARALAQSQSWSFGSCL